MTTCSEETYHLIAAHAAAQARLESSCDPADEIAARNAGRVVSEADIAEHEAALAEETETFNQLLAYTPPNNIQLQRKVGYLIYHLYHGETLDAEQVDLLLESLMKFRHRPA